MSQDRASRTLEDQPSTENVSGTEDVERLAAIKLHVESAQMGGDARVVLTANGVRLCGPWSEPALADEDEETVRAALLRAPRETPGEDVEALAGEVEKAVGDWMHSSSPKPTLIEIIAFVLRRALTATRGQQP